MRGTLALLALLLTLCGCVAPRRAAPGPTETSVIPGMPAGIRYLPPERDESGAQAAAFWRRLAQREGPVNLLAISGGGADCAFGAGALLGLERRGVRPEYDIVTGVSSGALLAPFALLGPAWNEGLAQLFTPQGAHGLLQLSASGTGLFSQRPLQALIERTYSDSMIAAVAQAAAHGRSLLVGTTDLDEQSPVIWDMTAIASVGTPASRALFRQILLASASYPGLLPPVLIEVATDLGNRQEMHVDGGTALRLFLGPLAEHLEPDAIGPMPQLHAYVLVNRRLSPALQSVPDRTIPALRRALSTQSRLSTRAALTEADEFARRHGFELQVADIAQQDEMPAPFSFHDPKLVTLFDTAQRRAALGSLWQSPAQALNPSHSPVVNASE